MEKPWLEIPKASDFSWFNLPYGIFSKEDNRPRAGVAIGEYVIDLARAYELNLFHELDFGYNVFNKPVLNRFIQLGRKHSGYVRSVLQEGLVNRNSFLKTHFTELFFHQEEVQMHLPLHIGDYTDFYSSEEHATTVGKLFRPDNPLFPNWKHLPVAYHGRASSIVISGTPVHRPMGQIGSDTTPIFSSTRALDYELELGFVIGKDSEMGKPVSVEHAESYVFGAVLFNDWSARDIQRWEYQPLGPFTAKNFASSISPWIVPMEALKYLRSTPKEQLPEPLPYLNHPERKGFDIHLSIAIQPLHCESFTVSNTNSKFLYWNISQQIAHHTITGCNLKVADLLATGTISGAAPYGAGCLLETTMGGKEPVQLSGGLSRRFLEDGDEVIIHGYGQNGDIRIGFGDLRGKVLPSIMD